MKHIHFKFSKVVLSLTLLFSLMMGSGCAQHGKAQIGASNPKNMPLQCKKVPYSTNKEQLCVMITVNHGDMWFFIGNTPYSDHLYVENYSVADGFADVLSDFTISPNGTYLSILSAAEGHPTLSFESMSYLRHGQISTHALPSFSVYPGTIFLDYWLNDHQAVVISDQDLIDYKHGSEIREAQAYLIDLPEGKVSLFYPE